MLQFTAHRHHISRPGPGSRRNIKEMSAAGSRCAMAWILHFSLQLQLFKINKSSPRSVFPPPLSQNIEMTFKKRKTYWDNKSRCTQHLTWAQNINNICVKYFPECHIFLRIPMHGFQRTFSLVPRLFTLSMIQKRIVKPAVSALNTQYSRARPTRIYWETINLFWLWLCLLSECEKF